MKSMINTTAKITPNAQIGRVSFHHADRSPLPDQSVYALQNTSHQLSQKKFRPYYHAARYVCCKSIVALPTPHRPNFHSAIRSTSAIFFQK